MERKTTVARSTYERVVKREGATLARFYALMDAHDALMGVEATLRESLALAEAEASAAKSMLDQTNANYRIMQQAHAEERRNAEDWRKVALRLIDATKVDA